MDRSVLSRGICAEICLSFHLRLLTHTARRPNSGIYLKKVSMFHSEPIISSPRALFWGDFFFFRITSLSFSENLWIRLGTRTEAAAKWWNWFWNVRFLCPVENCVGQWLSAHVRGVHWAILYLAHQFFSPSPLLWWVVFSFWEISALSGLSVPRICGDTVK